MTTINPASGGDNDSTYRAGSKSDEDVLKRIRQRYDYMVEAWRDIREAGEEDMRALSPKGPWDPDERATRKKEGRPCIHLDQLTQYTNGFMGEVRQSPIGVKVEPGNGGASDKTARLLNDRMRAIEYHSKASHATLTALENATERSYGAFGITLDYKSWDSDELVIKYRRFANPDGVLWDPDCKEADWSDMKDAIVEDWMSFDDFKQEFGDDAEVVSAFNADNTASSPNWFNFKTDMVRVIEYHCITKEPFTTKGGRKSFKPTYCIYLTNGIQILEKTEQPVPEIGIFPITGKERFIKDGDSGQVKRYLYSYIRMAVDGQMLFDYYKTNEAEEVGLTPKPKYAGYKGQFGDGEDYKNLNKSSAAFVEFEIVVDPVKQQVLDLPRWDSYEPNIQALELGSEAARRAIQAALGTYGFTRLDDTRVQSGKGIKELRDQGQLPSYHLIDNYKMSVQRAGRYEEQLIHVIEGKEPREVALRTEDGSHKIVKINQSSKDENGEEQFLRYRDSDDAEHTVTITDGPSYQSQRQEATAFADTLAASDQPWVAAIMDLVVKLKNLGPIGDQIADRLTPPEFRKDKEKEKLDPKQVQQQIQHYESALQDAMKQIDEYKSGLPKIQADKEIAQMKIDADKESRAYSDDVKLAIAEVSAKNKMQAEELSAFMLKMDHSLQLIMQEKEHLHEAGLAAGRSATDQQQQLSDQQHQQELSAQQQEAAAGTSAETPQA